MSDELRLLGVIVAIYLIDCLYWIPRGGIALTRFWRKTWSLRLPTLAAGNDRGALHLANPFPPLGVATRSVPWPISVSPNGLFSYTSAGFNLGGRPPQIANYFDWSQIQKIEREGKKVFVNGQLFHIGTSGYQARWVGEELSRLWKLGETKRPGAIRHLIRTTLSAEKLCQRLRHFDDASRTLRRLSNLLWIFLFMICPLVVGQFGLSRSILYLAAGLLLQTITVGILFRRLHKKLYPADKGELFKPFMTLLIAPPSAIRAQDILCRPLLESIHPLTAIRALCGAGDFQQFAGAYLRDLHFPRLPVCPPNTHEPAAKTEEWFRAELLAAVTSFLTEVKVDPDSFLAAPARSEQVHIAYCPRCLQQFTSVQGTCLDCGGRPLRPLEQPLATPA